MQINKTRLARFTIVTTSILNEESLHLVCIWCYHGLGHNFVKACILCHYGYRISLTTLALCVTMVTAQFWQVLHFVSPWLQHNLDKACIVCYHGDVLILCFVTVDSHLLEPQYPSKVFLVMHNSSYTYIWPQIWPQQLELSSTYDKILITRVLLMVGSTVLRTCGPIHKDS